MGYENMISKKQIIILLTVLIFSLTLGVLIGYIFLHNKSNQNAYVQSENTTIQNGDNSTGSLDKQENAQADNSNKVASKSPNLDITTSNNIEPIAIKVLDAKLSAIDGYIDIEVEVTNNTKFIVKNIIIDTFYSWDKKNGASGRGIIQGPTPPHTTFKTTYQIKRFEKYGIEKVVSAKVSTFCRTHIDEKSTKINWVNDEILTPEEYKSKYEK